jgi:hypothetical protein
MHDRLIARGFKQSKVDMCVYYCGNVVLLIYIDDGIFLAPDQAQIQQAFQDLSNNFKDASGKIHRAL